MNREDQLFIAKKTAERAGYTVKKDRREEERRERPRGYVYKPAQPVRREVKVINRVNPVAAAMKTAVDHGLSVTKREEKEERQQNAPSFVNKAVDFLQKDE